MKNSRHTKAEVLYPPPGAADTPYAGDCSGYAQGIGLTRL